MVTYNRYGEYLKNKYGDKVYKIPIHLPVTCPNRDGTCGKGGCTFCSEDGAGYEMLTARLSIKDQLEKNIAYIGKRYKAKYYIAYLQNYSNTYMPLEQFKTILNEIEHPQLVGISVSTRPDCIQDKYLDTLEEWAEERKSDVCIGSSDSQLPYVR